MCAVSFLQKSAGNNASTTLSSGVTDSDTSFPLVSDTLFLAGGGFVIIEEGLATEELAYYTGKSSGALTIPLANRGLEGGSAQGHAVGSSVKGVLSADMWNNVIETLANGFSATDGTLDLTKVVSLTGTQTLTNKTLTTPTLAKPVVNGTNPTAATYTPATGSQTVALDCAANNMHFVTGHASGTAITFTVANVTNSQPFIVSILQGGVVSTIAAWFATIRWAGGSAPTLTATINKRDTFGFIRTGADTYDGFIVGQNC